MTSTFAGTGPLLVSVAGIQCSATTVFTPVGWAPIEEAHFSLHTDEFVTEEVPVWAVVLAVAFVPLGLLFLLVKEPRRTFRLRVTVTTGGFEYTGIVPAPSEAIIQSVAREVDYCNVLAASRRW